MDLVLTTDAVSKCRDRSKTTLAYLLPVTSSVYSKNLFLKPLILQHAPEGFILDCKNIQAHSLQGGC